MPKAASKSSQREKSKRERFEARIPTELKQRLEQAAAIREMSISAFVLRQIEIATDEVLAEHQHRNWSKADQEKFFEALMNPPEPNEKLKAAARRYFGQKSL
jgi:uncharacterized protein (DUF1778 family)